MSTILTALVATLAVALPPRTSASASSNSAADSLREARAEAFASWLDDSVLAAVDVLVAAVREAAAELAAAPEGPDAERLAAELEYTLIRLETLAAGTRNPQLLSERLADVTLPPRHGGAFARLAWMHDDCAEELAVLTDWEFVGPFENERGVGMETELEPLRAPTAGSYEGKVRPVLWRRTPTPAPRGGKLRYYQLLDPTSQVCVLSRTWIASPEARTCLLQLGFEEEARVWLNGEPAFTALGVHEFARDAFAVQLELRAGWNELSVLVGAREGSPAFTARLTDAETGAPLRLESTGACPEGVEPHTASLGEAPAPVTPPGVRRVLGLGDSAEERLVASHLEAFFRAAPAASHPGRANAQAAVDLAPEDVAARVQLVEMLRADDRSEEQDVNPWLHAVEAVLALAPESSWAWRQMAYHAGWNQPTYRRALEQLERALARNPESVPALDMKILLLEHLDQSDLANALRERLLALPEIEAWPAIAVACARALPPSDERRGRLARAWFEVSGEGGWLETWAWREAVAGGRDGLGGRELVERVLALRIERNPWAVDALLDAAEDFLTLGDVERTIEVARRAEELSPDYARTQFWLARAHWLAGDIDRAVAALERELQLDFAAEDERRLLEHLREAGAAPFHEEFREPLVDVIRRVVVDPEAAAKLPSREVLLKRVVVRVHPDGTAQRYFRTVERILSEAGARDRDRIRFGSFSNQELRVLTADVLDIDGGVRPARTGRSAGYMAIDLPPLAVGDVIDLEWRLDDVRPTFFGDYFGFNETFSPDPTIPVYESEIVLMSPEEFPLRFHTRGDVDPPTVTRDEDGLTRARWIARAIQPIDPERFMPPMEEELAAVQASSYASWEEFGTWWWNLIEEEMRVSPEMEAKVAELTRDAATPAEKLRAIYDFVVTDIRYNAWEFGVHGYQPYEAPVIFSRGFGDCKDKAILLRALLSVVDIEAWPVLIRAEARRPEEDQELALVEHFNHCIAWVPAQDGVEEMFLDGTARHHPLEILPAMDNGAKVLVVRESGVERKTIPFAPAEANRVVSHFTVRVDEDHGARVRVERTPQGRYDPADRDRFTGSDEQRKEIAQNLLVSVLGPIDGEVETSFSDLEDLEQPVRIVLEADAKQLARPTDSGFELPAALSKHELLRTLAGETERATDLLVDVPRSSETVIRYELPPGTSPRDLPPPVQLECPDARYDWSATAVEGAIEVREVFELRSHRIPPESYGAFRELARGVDETQNAKLDVEVKP